MFIFKNLKIGVKLWLLLGLIVVLFGLVLYADYNRVNHLREIFEEIKEETQEMQIVMDFLIAIHQTAMPPHDYLIFGGEIGERANFEKSTQKTEKILEELEDYASNHLKEEEVLSVVKNNYFIFEQKALEIFNISEEELLSSPVAGKTMEDMDVFVDNVIFEMNKWYEFVDEEVGEASREFTATQKEIVYINNILGLLSVVISFVLGIIFIRSVTKPVKALIESTNDISQGKLDVKVVGLDQKDELGQLARSFDKMAKSLREKEKEKVEFITSASHQINTPSTGVRFQLQSLKKKIENGARKEEMEVVLKEIIDNNGRIVAITEDMFRLLELGDNYLASDLEKIKVKDLVSKIISSYGDEIENKKINVTVDILDNLEINTEESKIKYALINLIDNSIKYSNERGEINIKATRDSGLFKFEISDNGIGIPNKEQVHIFEEFFRATNSYLKASVGSGLGLTIAKTIVEGHGGNIGFTSKEGGGSTFWFTLS